MKCVEQIDIFEAMEMCLPDFLRENYSACVAMDNSDFHDGHFTQSAWCC